MNQVSSYLACVLHATLTTLPTLGVLGVRAGRARTPEPLLIETVVTPLASAKDLTTTSRSAGLGASRT